MEGELADIYGNLARMGVDPRRADGMELWEIGAAFGLHRPEEVEWETVPDPDWDPIAARIEAARTGKPAPTSPPMVKRRKVR